MVVGNWQGSGPCQEISNLIDKDFLLGLKSHSDCDPGLFPLPNKASPSPPFSQSSPLPLFPSSLDVSTSFVCLLSSQT